MTALTIGGIVVWVWFVVFMGWVALGSDSDEGF
jgi:hypothetical protein